MTKLCVLLVVLCLLVVPALARNGDRSRQSQTGLSASEISAMRKRLRKEFGFSLPATARIMKVASSASKRVKFVGVKMPVSDAIKFKEKLVALRRPKTQWFLHEDKDSGTHIGSMPVHDEPAGIEEWQAENKFTGGETMIYIQNVKQLAESEFKTVSYLVMFSQESTGLAYFYYYPAKR